MKSAVVAERPIKLPVELFQDRFGTGLRDASGSLWRLDIGPVALAQLRDALNGTSGPLAEAATRAAELERKLAELKQMNHKLAAATSKAYEEGIKILADFDALRAEKERLRGELARAEAAADRLGKAYVNASSRLSSLRTRMAEFFHKLRTMEPGVYERMEVKKLWEEVEKW